MARSTVLCALALLGMLPAESIAQVDTALLRGLKYRLVGPSRGGRVTAVPGVPSQPRTFYMGVASGGVFRTTDAGETWVPITDGKVPVGSIGAIAVAESNPDIIYVGTGSDGVRSNAVSIWATESPGKSPSRASAQRTVDRAMAGSRDGVSINGAGKGMP